MKKTKWFAAKTKPTLPGVYETRVWMDVGDIAFQMWNGRQWGRRAPCESSAKDAGRDKSVFQDVFWRGLASDPSKAGSKA